MKKAHWAAARLCALGLALTVFLAVSPAVEGIASPDEQHTYPEVESKTGDVNRHGLGLHTCTDHANRTFTIVEDETPGGLRYRDPIGFPARTATTDTPRTWTVLFYDDADFANAYDPFYDFINDAHSDVNVNVVILRDRNDRIASVWHVDERHRPRLMGGWGEVSMARAATLKRFIDWGKANYPADRYLLAMYDHGGGWRGACNDVTNGGSLTMREIAQGIGEAGGVDILAFTAPCLMGAMESVYEVRDCVDVYIGSEDLSGYIFWIGLMGNICDVLNDSESLSNEDIGKQIIGMIEHNPRWAANPNQNRSIMSAMTTSGVTLAAQQLDVIAEYLSVHTALLFDDLATSRERTWRLGSAANYNTKSVDVYDFTLKLSERVSDPFLLQALQDLRDLLDDAVIAECDRQTSRTHGLSLYFPSRAADGYAPVYGRVLDMTHDTAWNEFLRAFYRCQITPRGDLAGSVAANCPTPGSPLEGVTVTACQASTGDLLGAAVSDSDGSYEIKMLMAGDYIVAAIPPLGYAMADGEINVTLPGGILSGVDMALSCTGESNDPRGTAYWKRAIGEAMGGGGQALVDATEICAYLDAIDAHFTARGIDVYAPPAASTCDVKLAAAADLLCPLPPVKTDGVARCHLMALLLNVAAGNMRTDDVISKDGATVSQAISYCYDLLGTRPVDALVIANLINNGVVVPSGRIPLSTTHIAFAPPTPSGVDEPSIAPSLSVSVNPNPFNPTTTISFVVPQSSHVTLSIYDISGHRVNTLVDRTIAGGIQRAVWNGRDAAGNPASSGVYFYRVKTGNDVAVGKMLLLK